MSEHRPLLTHRGHLAEMRPPRPLSRAPEHSRNLPSLRLTPLLAADSTCRRAAWLEARWVAGSFTPVLC